MLDDVDLQRLFDLGKEERLGNVHVIAKISRKQGSNFTYYLDEIRLHLALRCIFKRTGSTPMYVCGNIPKHTKTYQNFKTQEKEMEKRRKLLPQLKMILKKL
jgi:hypothetical protein